MAYSELGGNVGIQSSQASQVVTQNWTIMCWVYVETTSEQGVFFEVGQDQNTAGNGYGLAVGATIGGNAGNDFIPEIAGVAWEDTNVTIGTGWHHLAGVDRGGFQFYYIDGAFIFSANRAAVAPTANVQIGTNGIPNTGGNLSAGNRVAHCKAWTSALGTAQIQTEMNSGFPVFNYDSLSMYWAFEKSGGAGANNNGIDFTQKFGTTGNAVGTIAYADNPPVARC